MKCGIVVIGNEVLQGYVQDINSGWIARRLTGLGFDVKRILVVGDVIQEIVGTLNLLLKLGLDAIFVCGGLGGTTDDVTVLALSKCFKVKLVKDEAVFKEILRKIELLQKKGIKVEPSKWILRMAYIPEGSVPLKNSLGSAPGIMLKQSGTTIFVLPGVPVEMKTIFAEEVEPRLGFGEKRSLEVSFRAEETKFCEVVDKLEKEYKKIAIGLYPQFGKLQVTIRIMGEEKEVLAAREKIVEEAEKLGILTIS